MKNAAKIAGFFLIVTLSVFLCYRVLSMKDTNGLVGSSVTQLKYTDNNKIDVAFVGSSHVFAGISPRVMWNEYGISAFDLSVSGMDMDSIYYYTKHLLKTQSPKYVFIDGYSFTFLKHAVIENEYRNLLGMPISANSINLVKDYMGDENKEAVSDYLLRWPIIHTRYKELTVNDFVDLGIAKYGRGEREENKNTAPIYLDALEYKEVAKLDKEREDWLKAMEDLSKEAGFELVFCVIPYSVTETDQSYINALEEYCGDNGLTFFDFNRMVKELGIDLYKDTSDALHLNATGAEKLSKWIGNYLSNDKGLADHRGEAGYEYWQYDATYRAHERSVDYLNICHDSKQYEEFFETLGSLTDVSFVVSLDGDWVDRYDDYINYLCLLGIDINEIGDGGVWVKVNGGRILKISDDLDTEVHYVDFDKYNSARISRSEAKDLNEIKIGENSGQTGYNGINIAVYNNIKYELAGCWYY